MREFKVFALIALLVGCSGSSPVNEMAVGGQASSGAPTSAGSAGAPGGAGGSSAVESAGRAGAPAVGGASGQAAGGAPTAGAPATSAGAGGELNQGGSSGGHGGSAGDSSAGSGGPGGSSASPAPCDLYAAEGTPCVAAHSTVRALFAAYSAKLYQVRRASDSTTKAITALSAGGPADAAAQDTFCAGTSCVITFVYDQSGHGNDLEYQGQGSAVGGQDKPASATTESLSVGGHKVYSLYINAGNSYWRDGHASSVPLGSAPEGIYMVTSGTHVNSGCCFDYGNSETDRKADGAGAMDAIYFGTSCWFGGCSGTGPWVQADLEYGLFPGGSKTWNPKQTPLKTKFVTAMLKNNGTTKLALKGGNAQAGTLTTLWDGALPSGYNPMKKQGAIVLGSGGDCCATNNNQSYGTFYEGAIVSGYPSDAAEAAVQNNIIAAGYQ
ncbi:MAG TPA: arabinofuranosidase catalytic domain-containing protein [Polyangiaceae bacterium]|nr:arabinofuranosidase catalytic domain-containing protein [Polyangiaceae bacterium]